MLTLGEFRKKTAHLSDDTPITVDGDEFTDNHPQLTVDESPCIEEGNPFTIRIDVNEYNEGE